MNSRSSVTLVILVMGAALAIGAIFVFSQPTYGQATDPVLTGADAEIIAGFLPPSLNPLPVSEAFLGNANTSIISALSKAELLINPLPLTSAFIGNATTFFTNTLVKPPITPIVSNEAILAERFLPILYFHEDEKYRPQDVQVAFDTAALFLGNDFIVGPALDPELLALLNDSDYKLDLLGDTFLDGYENTAYTHIVEDEGHIVLQYWFFYYFNDWEGSVTDPIEDFQHEGDWEMIQLIFPKDKSVQDIVEENTSPSQAVYSAHAGGYKEDWGAVEKDGDRPVVYVAKGSHANHFQPGFCDVAPPRALGVDEIRPQTDPFDVTISQPILDPINNTEFKWLLFGGKWGSQSNSPRSPFRQDVFGTNKWTTPFAWLDAKVPVINKPIIISWSPFYQEHCDGDFDGIWNNADPEPTVLSSDFDAPGFLKNTSGTITNRGDREIKIKDAEVGGVHITSNFGTKRATIKFDTFKCMVVGTLPVVGPFLFIPPFVPFAGTATCGSTEISAEEGTAELQITVGHLDVIGTVNAGQTIKYSIVDDQLQIETAGEGEIPLTINGEPVVIQAGETYSVLEVFMDIKPSSDINPINCTAESSIIPIIIATTGDFDATMIDPTTVSLEGAPETHNKLHQEDIDGDGNLDAILHFRLGDTTLNCISTQATLTGKTTNDHLFIATNSIDTTPN